MKIFDYIKSNKYDIIIYIAIASTVLGQVIIGWEYYIGQGGFLCANALYLYRDIKLDRPKSEIIKDVIFTALTVGLIIVYALSK